jgi:tetratricopeptide (TPR) repeat protein
VSPLALVAAAALAAMAAAGVLYPFLGDREVRLERLADPLEEERAGLLRALRDLEDDRAAGSVSEADYRTLRADTEARAVAVLRALEAREGAGALAAGLKEIRSERGPQPEGHAEGSSRSGPGRRRPALSLLVGAVILAVLVPVLAAAVRGRDAGQPISGDSAGAQDPLSFFEDRVRRHPDDVAARLDLAQRYLGAGDAEDAVAQYLAALRLDPRNPEARATLGFLLFRAGKVAEGLQAVDKALEVDPTYPEALYFKGVILLRGEHRPDDAAAAFRAYLRAAPFGSRRQEVQGLLRQAERTPAASPSPSA